MKLIYFHDVKFSGYPLIWEVNSDETQATCTYKLYGSKEIFSLSKTKLALSAIQNITFNENRAIIQNLKEFQKVHKPQKIDKKEMFQSNRATSVPSNKLPQLYKKNKSFFTESKKPPLSPSQKNPSASYNTIEFEHLMESYRGEIGCHYPLIENNIRSLQSLDPSVLNHTNIISATNVLEALTKTKLKVLQINKLKELFVILNSSYVNSFPKSTPPDQFIKFLQNVVLNCTRLNLNYSAPQGNDSKNALGLMEQFKEQVNTKLLGLRLFICPDSVKKELTENNQEIANTINQMKEHVVSEKKMDEVIKLIKDIEDIKLARELIELKYKTLTKPKIVDVQINFAEYVDRINNLHAQDPDIKTVVLSLKEIAESLFIKKELIEGLPMCKQNYLSLTHFITLKLGEFGINNPDEITQKTSQILNLMNAFSDVSKKYFLGITSQTLTKVMDKDIFISTELKEEIEKRVAKNKPSVEVFILIVAQNINLSMTQGLKLDPNLKFNQETKENISLIQNKIF